MADVKTTPALMAEYEATANIYDTFIRPNHTSGMGALLPRYPGFRRLYCSRRWLVADSGQFAAERTKTWRWRKPTFGSGSRITDSAIGTGNPTRHAFKTTLTLDDNGQAYAWNYANPVLPGDYFVPSPTSEDASHGNIDVLFAIEAYQQGMVFRQPIWPASKTHLHK